MAKTGMIERNNKRRRLAARDANKRADLKVIANDRALPMEERFAERLKLAQLPRNGSKPRRLNRWEVPGPRRAGRVTDYGIVSSFRRYAYSNPERADAQPVKSFDACIKAARPRSRRPS